MGFLQSIHKKLNKAAPGGKRVVPNASQFVQATRSKANEAREKLRSKPQAQKPPPKPAAPHKTAPASAPSAVGAPKPAPSAAGALQGRTGARKAPAGQLAPAAKPGAAAPSAAKPAAAAAKDVREVASGPRGGKFVQGPAGTKHYVK